MNPGTNESRKQTHILKINLLLYGNNKPDDDHKCHRDKSMASSVVTGCYLNVNTDVFSQFDLHSAYEH